MLPFPSDEIRNEDEALAWWADKFAAGCETMNMQADAATLIRALVSSLREIREAAHARPLPLAEAARMSGYSRDHLARLIRDGKLPNVGRKHAPRVLERDLPKRPSALAARSARAYDTLSDARSLRSRR
jgi:hypothetical protein